MNILSHSVNYSFYAIPAAVMVAYYPALAKGYILGTHGVFNNATPRGYVAKLQASPNPKISQELTAKAARTESAHYNGLENLPFFGLSILAANYAGVEVDKLNLAAALYIGLRVLYNYVYINQTKTSTGYLRTLVWYSGMTIPFYLSFKAAGKLSTQ